MTAKHTPEWKVMAEKDDSSPDPENPTGYYIAYDESDVITDVELCKGITDEKTARLIAAAPDLLAACKITGNQITDDGKYSLRGGGKLALYFTLEQLESIQSAISAGESGE